MRLIAVLALTLALAGCSGSPTSSKVVSDTGTVRYMNLEGGFYGILGDAGGHYDPVNLPTWAQTDGLRVRFTARTEAGGVSFHMWGTMVRIESIAALK